MKLINLLRSILSAPFIVVAWVFFKAYQFIDPYCRWELDYYDDIFVEFINLDDYELACTCEDGKDCD